MRTVTWYLKVEWLGIPGIYSSLQYNLVYDSAHSHSTRPTRPSSSSAQRPRPSPRRQLSVENDYPELSGDFALRGASNSKLCAADGTGMDGSNGNVLQNSQARKGF